jgi:seryl-tRNA synthetase
MTREEVYSVIDEERAYQDKTWGTVEERQKQVGSWLTLLRFLITEADKQWSTTKGDTAALHQVRKIAGVSIACMEQHGAPKREEKTSEVDDLKKTVAELQRKLEHIRNTLHKQYNKKDNDLYSFDWNKGFNYCCSYLLEELK